MKAARGVEKCCRARSWCFAIVFDGIGGGGKVLARRQLIYMVVTKSAAAS